MYILYIIYIICNIYNIYVYTDILYIQTYIRTYIIYTLVDVN